MHKSTKIIVSLIILLVVVRVALPSILLKLINKELSNLEEYHGKLEDLDLNLYRGAYVLKGLNIEKVKGEFNDPYLNIKSIDASIHWKALLKGKIVGEVILDHPQLNFEVDSTGNEIQTGEEFEWMEMIDKLFPFDVTVNLFQVNKGEVYFKDFSQQPLVDVGISNISVKATNLSNIDNQSDSLPASYEISGTTNGEGKLRVFGHLNFMREVPDFDMNFKLNDLKLVSLNNFSKAYGSFDFEEGQFSLTTELLLFEKKYQGYIKPFFEEVKIIDYSAEKDNSFFQKVWETAIAIPAEMLQNQKEEQLATKVPLEGNLKESDPKIFKAILNLFKNAFVKAIPKNIEHTVQYKE